MNVYDKNGNALNLLKDSDIESGNGYIKLPDGTAIVYCKGSLTHGANKSIVLPIRIDGFGRNAIVTVTGNWAGTVRLENVYDGEVFVNVNAQSSSSVGYSLIAIGKWK